MRKLLGLYVRFKNSRGASATEYALIITLVALAIIATAGVLGGEISDAFERASNSLKTV
jgi:pilus assembly protein Flp/PilA